MRVTLKEMGGKGGGIKPKKLNFVIKANNTKNKGEKR